MAAIAHIVKECPDEGRRPRTWVERRLQGHEPDAVLEVIS